MKPIEGQNPPAVPPLVLKLADGHPLHFVWRNERGGLTYKANGRFIKWNPLSSGIDLAVERAKLLWTIRYHPVPRVISHGEDDTAQWLITEGMPGTSAVADPWISRPLESARAIGRGLRQLHDTLPVDACPFDWSVESRTAHWVSSKHPAVPPVEHLVVCHGDACSPNTLIGPDGAFAGHVDMGQLGVADRWADLAVASMSLDWNFSPGWEQEFFTAYGIAPDEERIAFYRHLWENEDTLCLP